MSRGPNPEDPGATPPDPDAPGRSQGLPSGGGSEGPAATRGSQGPAAVRGSEGPSPGLADGWAGGLPLEEILAAARRHFRSQAGRDVAAWGEPDADSGRPDATGHPAAGDSGAEPRPSAGAPEPQPSTGAPEPHPSTGEASDQRAAEGALPQAGPAAGSPPGRAAGPSPGLAEEPTAPDDEDPFGEEELRAAEQGASQAVPLDDLAGHARLTPGPTLAGWLSGTDAGQLDDAALANSITAWRKVTSWAQARELAAVAELARRRGVALAPQPGRPRADQLQADFAPNEIALALTLTGCSADYWMSFAVSLDSRLPATLAALAGGRIDLARAKLIDQYTTVLDDELARMVEARVLPKAERQTTGQLRAALLRAVIAVDPAAAERRREEAERNARVELAGEPDGTASLLGRFLPAAQASAAWTRIDIIASALQDSGAAGGIDLLRAQVLLRLLLGQPPAPPAAEDTPAGPDRRGPADSGPAGSHGPPGDQTLRRHRPWPGCTWPDLSFDGAITGLGEALSRALRRRAVLAVPWRTLAALIEEPGQLGRIGPVTPSVTRQLAQAAAADATCEWRIVVVNARGHPVAVTTIRPPPTRQRWPGAESPPGRVPGQPRSGLPGSLPAGSPGSLPAGLPGSLPAGLPGSLPAWPPGQSPRQAPGRSSGWRALSRAAQGRAAGPGHDHRSHWLAHPAAGHPSHWPRTGDGPRHGLRTRNGRAGARAERCVACGAGRCPPGRCHRGRPWARPVPACPRGPRLPGSGQHAGADRGS